MSLCADRHSASKELSLGAGAVGAGAAVEEAVDTGGGVVTPTASNVVDGIGVGMGVSIGGGTTEVGTGPEGEEEGRGRRDLVKL